MSQELTVGAVRRHSSSARSPLFATADVALYRGDALAVLRSLPTASVDACVTDPPYGERAARWDGPRCREWYVSWLREVHRVVVPDGPIVSFAPRRRFDVIMSALREVRGDPPEAPLQMLVWVHRQGFRPAPGYLRPEHEAIVVSGLLRVQDEDARAERVALANSWSRSRDERGASRLPAVGTVLEASRTARNERTGHPTQKPMNLLRFLVVLAAPAGGTVIDPLCGSGTTLAAARLTGRRAVGIDRSIRACRIAAGRLRAAEGRPMIWPADGCPSGPSGSEPADSG